MNFVQDTLPELSQFFVGLLFASLVVFVVLLIGLIVYRKNRTARRDGGSKGLPAGADPSAEESSAEIVTLTGGEEAPEARAKRFQFLANEALTSGRLGDAKALYEKTLAVSADHKLIEIKADARYELGNLCKAQNDLPSACEHWQGARKLYHELGDKKRVRDLDNIMTDAQCPPDWIMTKL